MTPWDEQSKVRQSQLSLTGHPGLLEVFDRSSREIHLAPLRSAIGQPSSARAAESEAAVLTSALFYSTLHQRGRTNPQKDG